MHTTSLPVTLDWENDCISIGSQSFTLEQIKYEDHAIREVIRECMDDTERAILRLSYPAWYTELFEIINMTELGDKIQPTLDITQAVRKQKIRRGMKTEVEKTIK